MRNAVFRVFSLAVLKKSRRNLIICIAGDLWSFNADLEKFVVSPEPDVDVFELREEHCCLVLGSDGIIIGLFI